MVDPAMWSGYNELGMYFDLAKELHKARRSSLHEKEGYDSFRSFVEDCEIGRYRKAMYLVGIIDDMKHLRYTPGEVKALMDDFGWSKLSIILAGLPNRVARTLLVKKYGHMTLTEVKAEFAPNQGLALFTAQIPVKQRAKLYRLLQKQYGLAKSKGKKEKVGDAFSDLLDWVFDKHKV